MAYLDIATKFRNNEFYIQMLRNMMFTGAQALMLICYTTTLDKHRIGALATAGFGVILSVLWWLYYRSSLYWAWYWEWRCREVNDKIVDVLDLGVNIFTGHPSGCNEKKPMSFKFGGRTISEHQPVHRILQTTQIAFCALWLLLLLSTTFYWPNVHPQESSIKPATVVQEQPTTPTHE
jgi:hypothetical protein